MERRDERESAAPRTIGEHLPRQQRAHGMRNRVVHVKQIEIIELRNLSHSRGQRRS